MIYIIKKLLNLTVNVIHIDFFTHVTEKYISDTKLYYSTNEK